VSIHLYVYVSPYKPIANLLPRPGSDGRPVPINRPFPSWDSRQQATFAASSASLISGEREAVLIDALITIAEAQLRRTCCKSWMLVGRLGPAFFMLCIIDIVLATTKPGNTSTEAGKFPRS
jgi:hypothetical protein